MSKNRIAVFPGSFDPLTNGHVDIVKRSLEVFEKLIVAVVENPSKQAMFTVEERKNLIQEEFSGLGDRVEAGSFKGLLVDYLKELNVYIVIRGLRAISDFDYETQMALVNRNLNPRVETFFLMAKEENSYISSSLVKQIAPLGGDVSKFVPKVVQKALKAR